MRTTVLTMLIDHNTVEDARAAAIVTVSLLNKWVEEVRTFSKLYAIRFFLFSITLTARDYNETADLKVGWLVV